MKSCGICETQNADQARFCSECGESLLNELESFLKQSGLEALGGVLRQNDFSSPEELLALNDEDYKELGLTLGQKIRLKKALEELAANDEQDNDEQEYEDEENEPESVQDEQTAADAVAENFAKLSSVDRVYLAPNIPADKLSAAFGSYVRRQGVEALLLYDVTMFQGAKDGFVVSRDGLYLKESFQAPEYYPYESIHDVHVYQDSKLFVNHKQVMNCIGIAPISLRRIAAVIKILADIND